MALPRVVEFQDISWQEKQEPLRYHIREPMKIFILIRILDILSHPMDDMLQHIIQNLYLLFQSNVHVLVYIQKQHLLLSILRLQDTYWGTTKYQKISKKFYNFIQLAIRINRGVVFDTKDITPGRRI